MDSGALCMIHIGRACRTRTAVSKKEQGLEWFWRSLSLGCATVCSARWKRTEAKGSKRNQNRRDSDTWRRHEQMSRKPYSNGYRGCVERGERNGDGLWTKQEEKRRGKKRVARHDEKKKVVKSCVWIAGLLSQLRWVGSGWFRDTVSEMKWWCWRWPVVVAAGRWRGGASRNVGRGRWGRVALMSCKQARGVDRAHIIAHERWWVGLKQRRSTGTWWTAPHHAAATNGTSVYTKRIKAVRLPACSPSNTAMTMTMTISISMSMSMNEHETLGKSEETDALCLILKQRSVLKIQSPKTKS